MLKVLYLLNFAGKAGTERYVETLVKYLAADGLVQPFFAYNEGGLLVERLEAMGVPCRRVEMRRRFDKRPPVNWRSSAPSGTSTWFTATICGSTTPPCWPRSTIKKSAWSIPTILSWPTTS